MSSTSMTALREDARMSKPGPRAGGPTSRRSFTSAQKLDHIAAYEAAMQKGDGGAYLRANGLYSSLMCEWRRQRDAGVLAGKKPGEKIGKLTAEQTEIAQQRNRHGAAAEEGAGLAARQDLALDQQLAILDGDARGIQQ